MIQRRTFEPNSHPNGIPILRGQGRKSHHRLSPTTKTNWMWIVEETLCVASRGLSHDHTKLLDHMIFLFDCLGTICQTQITSCLRWLVAPNRGYAVRILHTWQKEKIFPSFHIPFLEQDGIFDKLKSVLEICLDICSISSRRRKGNRTCCPLSSFPPTW